MLISSAYEVRLAKDAEDLFAVQRLRYDVFVRELGACGLAVDHDLEIEVDGFDRHCEHLMVLDRMRGADLTEQLVGVYRIMNRLGATSSLRPCSVTPMITNRQSRSSIRTLLYTPSAHQ